jgi:hypothetical protein
MHVRFTSDEVLEIVRAHVIDKLGMPSESVGDYYFCDDDGDQVEEPQVNVEIKTNEQAVPVGPYRTPSK